MAHQYILGGSGAGKSTLLKQLILDDINSGYGVCFIDPHGYDTDDLIQHIPRKRLKDTIVFDPTDPTHFITWNPLEESNNPPLMASTLSDTIKDAWGYHGVTTPVMDMYLYFTISSLIENKLSFYKSLQLLTDGKFRASLTFSDIVLGRFWDTFDEMTPKEQRDITASTLNKLFTLFGDVRIRRLLDVKKGQFRVAEAIKDKILFVRLPQGQLGMSKVSLIGSILLSQIHLACLARDTTSPFSVYVDEVHTFAPTILAEMLSGLRKFNVHVTVAHQYLDQLDKVFLASLLGNCQYRHIFRVSREDAERLQERFGKFGSHADLDELANYRYRTFPWHSSNTDQETKPLPIPTSPNMAERVIRHTHNNYCKVIP